MDVPCVLIHPLLQKPAVLKAFDKNDVLTAARKSCDFCRSKKKKCIWDGVNPCSSCVTACRKQCIFGRRQQHKRRQRRVDAVSPPHRRSSTSGSPGNKSRRGSEDSSTASEIDSSSSTVVRLRRADWQPSMAVGLVGWEENALLNHFFACLDFLRITTRRAIRESMLMIMLRRVSQESSEMASRDPLLEEATSSPSACVFWCAIALGGLVQGRPVSSVAKYMELAREALKQCFYWSTPGVARAFTAMAYVQAYAGDTVKFRQYSLRAEMILRDMDLDKVQGEPDQLDFIHLVHRTRAKSFYMACARAGDGLLLPESSVAHSGAHSEASCRTTSKTNQSYRLPKPAIGGPSFVRPDKRLRNCAMAELFLDFGKMQLEDGGAGAPETVSSEGEASIQAEEHAGRSLDADSYRRMIKRFLEEFAYPYERLEYDVDNAEARRGFEACVMNGQLMVLKALQNDIPGTIERAKRCSTELDRYPGLCRSPSGLHMARTTAAIFALLDMKESYERVRNAFNKVQVSEHDYFPPFDQWELGRWMQKQSDLQLFCRATWKVMGRLVRQHQARVGARQACGAGQRQDAGELQPRKVPRLPKPTPILTEKSSAGPYYMPSPRSGDVVTGMSAEDAMRSVSSWSTRLESETPGNSYSAANAAAICDAALEHASGGDKFFPAMEALDASAGSLPGPEFSEAQMTQEYVLGAGGVESSMCAQDWMELGDVLQ